ncbi:MAG: hypothetical protein HYZ81_08255 [Nitrospinae bacterium]|nr:hypothetical protein [Nitrospinota bacterium]
MGLWTSIHNFFRDAKLTEYYVKISKEEFQGNLQRASDMCDSARQFVEASELAEDVKQRNLAKIEAWQRDLQRKLSVLGPREVTRERRRFF